MFLHCGSKRYNTEFGVSKFEAKSKSKLLFFLPSPRLLQHVWSHLIRFSPNCCISEDCSKLTPQRGRSFFQSQLHCSRTGRILLESKLLGVLHYAQNRKLSDFHFLGQAIDKTNKQINKIKRKTRYIF